MPTTVLQQVVEWREICNWPKQQQVKRQSQLKILYTVLYFYSSLCIYLQTPLFWVSRLSTRLRSMAVGICTISYKNISEALGVVFLIHLKGVQWGWGQGSMQDTSTSTAASAHHMSGLGLLGPVNRNVKSERNEKSVCFKIRGVLMLKCDVHRCLSIKCSFIFVFTAPV